MNKLILALALLCSNFFFAQNKTSFADTIQVKKEYFKINLNDLPVIQNTIDFKSVNAYTTQFSIYNTYSTYNDVYFLQNGNYYRSNSNLVLENNLRGSKIDSFNPFGATDLGTAVVFGFINFLLDKNISFKLPK